MRKADYARLDYYDVWLPVLAPQPETVKLALAASSAAERRAFERRYRAEMRLPEPARTLELLAALSHQTNFSVGCYCEDEARCHRRILRELLAAHGAELA